MIERILVDWQGVLVEKMSDDMLAAIAADLDVPADIFNSRFRAEFYDDYLTGKIRDETRIWRALAESLGGNYNGEPLWKNHADEFYRPIDEMFEFVARLRDKGHSLWLVTDAEPPVERFFAEPRYRPFGDNLHIITSCEQKVKKPVLYREARAVAGGYPPQNYLVIENNYSNVQAVRKDNMQAVLAEHPDQTMTDVQRALTA